MWGTLRGSNGVSLIAGGAISRSTNAAPMQVQYETKLSAKIDGGQQNGMLVMHAAVEKAVEKARQHGVGLVGTNNTTSTTGALGYYLDTIAQNGLVGLLFAQTPTPTAPTTPIAGQPAVLGANPLGVSVP